MVEFVVLSTGSPLARTAYFVVLRIGHGSFTENAAPALLNSCSDAPTRVKSVELQAGVEEVVEDGVEEVVEDGVEEVVEDGVEEVVEDGVEDGVEGVEDGVEGVEGGVEGVEDGVEGVEDGVEGVEGGVEGVEGGVEGVEGGAGVCEEWPGFGYEQVPVNLLHLPNKLPLRQA